jgi:hypothetical protein
MMRAMSGASSAARSGAMERTRRVRMRIMGQERKD